VHREDQRPAVTKRRKILSVQTVDPFSRCGPPEGKGKVSYTTALRDANCLGPSPCLEEAVEHVRRICAEKGEVVLAAVIEQRRDQTSAIRRIAFTFAFRAMRIDSYVHRRSGLATYRAELVSR
jgi:hypothetical protein